MPQAHRGAREGWVAHRSGGLSSTAADLAELYSMMPGGGALRGTRSEPRILMSESVEAMTRLQPGDPSAGLVPGMGFGYGWSWCACRWA